MTHLYLNTDLVEGVAKVGAADKGVEERGSVCLYLGKVLNGGFPGSFTVWVRDVGDDTTHWEGIGLSPPQDGPKDDGKVYSPMAEAMVEAGLNEV